MKWELKTLPKYADRFIHVPLTSCQAHPHSSKGIWLITLCAETWSKPSGPFTVIESIFIFWNPISFTGDFQACPALEGEWEVSPQVKAPCLHIELEPEGPPTARTLRGDSPWEHWWVPKTCGAQATLWTGQRFSHNYMGAQWMGRGSAQNASARWRGSNWGPRVWFWYKLWPSWALWC